MSDFPIIIAGHSGAINPRLRLVLTVSPVPLVATVTAQHALCASNSKAVLRVAAHALSRAFVEAECEEAMLDGTRTWG